VRLNDCSRRSGAFELRVRHPPVIQDPGGTKAAMSSPLGSTQALEPDAYVRRPHAPACARMTAVGGWVRLSCVCGTPPSFRI